jgi:hypothetical protein
MYNFVRFSLQHKSTSQCVMRVIDAHACTRFIELLLFCGVCPLVFDICYARVIRAWLCGWNEINGCLRKQFYLQHRVHSTSKMFTAEEKGYREENYYFHFLFFFLHFLIYFRFRVTDVRHFSENYQPVFIYLRLIRGILFKIKIK